MLGVTCKANHLLMNWSKIPVHYVLGTCQVLISHYFIFMGSNIINILSYVKKTIDLYSYVAYMMRIIRIYLYPRVLKLCV
jgi:hypothetical protein